MEKLKKYFRYILLLVAIYFIVTVLTNIRMDTTKIKSLKSTIIPDDRINIEIEEKEMQNIKLKVTNKTNDLLRDIFVKVDLYNDSNYVTSKYKEIKYLNVGETNNIEINFTEEKINGIKISIVDKIIEKEENVKNSNSNDETTKEEIKVEPEISSETIEMALPIATALGLGVILP